MLTPEDIIEERKRWDEFRSNYVKEHPEEYDSSRKLDEWRKARQAQGVIINTSIRNWLEGEITAARVALVVGMLLTTLIKGQIVIWAIMYIAYRSRAKRAREKAYEADRRSYKK